MTCAETYDGHPCVKDAGHRGPHYADLTDATGVSWGNVDAEGWPR